VIERFYTIDDHSPDVPFLLWVDESSVRGNGASRCWEISIDEEGYFSFLYGAQAASLGGYWSAVFVGKKLNYSRLIDGLLMEPVPFVDQMILEKMLPVFIAAFESGKSWQKRIEL
jgi:hypothetical protein